MPCPRTGSDAGLSCAPSLGVGEDAASQSHAIGIVSAGASSTGTRPLALVEDRHPPKSSKDLELAMDQTVERSALRKIYIRLLPLAVLSYFLAYVDRINVSFAALTMRGDLKMSAAAYGFALEHSTGPISCSRCLATS